MEADNEQSIVIQTSAIDSNLMQITEGTGLITDENGITYQVVFEQGVTYDEDNSEFVSTNNSAIELAALPENGTQYPETKDNVKKEIAIQANDYEIERRSGRVPARQRFIPAKFRDFHDGSDIEEDQKDVDYKPNVEDLTPKPRKESVNYLHSGRKKKRRRGRPRKKAVDHNYDALSCPPTVDPVIKEKELETLQEADQVTYRYDCNHGDCKNVQFKSYYLYKKHIQANHKGENVLRGKGRPPKGTESATRLFTCLICEKKFSQKSNLKVHMSIHTGAKPYRCERAGCSHAFRTAEALAKHLVAAHGDPADPRHGPGAFACHTCDRLLSSKTALREHEAIHTGQYPHACTLCHKRFRQASCFYRHMLLHSDERRFKCTVCGKGFTQHIYLKVHMRSHTGEKPYKCKTCGKRFAYQSDLGRHQNVHFGQKKYGCEVCGARFSDPSSRRRHLREHVDGKPYVCHLCGEDFKRAGQLKAHLSKKHLQQDAVVVAKTTSSAAAVAIAGFQVHRRGNPTADGSGDSAGDAPPAGALTQIIVQDGSGREHVVLVPADFSAALGASDGAGAATPEARHILAQIQQHIDTAATPPLDGGTESTQVAYQMLPLDTSGGSNQFESEESQQELSQPTSETMFLDTTIHSNSEEIVQLSEAEVSLEQTDDVDLMQTLGAEVEATDLPQQELETSEEVILADSDVEDGSSLVAGSQQPTFHFIGKDNYESAGSDMPIKAQKHLAKVVSLVKNKTLQQERKRLRIQGTDVTENETKSHRVVPIPFSSPSLVTSNEFTKSEIHFRDITHLDAAEALIQVTNQSLRPQKNNSPLIPNSTNEMDVQNSHTGSSDKLEFEQDQNTEVTESNGQNVNENTETKDHDASCEELSIFDSVFIKSPSFASQEYYNWLSLFVDQCKWLDLPLAKDIFESISFVNKSISDVLAAPTGVLTSKTNFRILNNMSRDLYGIINNHLAQVMEGLEDD